MESYPGGIRINKFLTQLDLLVGIYIQKVQIIIKVNFNSSLKMLAPAIGADGDCFPYIKLVLHDKFYTILHYTIHVGRFLSNSLRDSTSSSFLYLLLLFIN